MANTVYVNVGGTWRTVSNYYVNVNGVWKTGTAFANNVSGTWKGATAAPSGPVSLPTALEMLGLEYAEFMCLPFAIVASKQGLTSGDTLDLAEWQTKPVWYLDSTFVYSAPPASGPSILPTRDNLLTLDYAEWQTKPQVYLSISGLAQMDDLDVAEFMCLPYYGITPAAPASQPPPPVSLPTASNVVGLEYAEFMCLPQVYVGSKSTVNNNTLDYAEWQTKPAWMHQSSFVYTAPPAPGPSIIPSAANVKTLNYAEWQTKPQVFIDSKTGLGGEGSLDYSEFMCLPYFTKSL